MTHSGRLRFSEGTQSRWSQSCTSFNFSKKLLLPYGMFKLKSHSSYYSWPPGKRFLFAQKCCHIVTLVADFPSVRICLWTNSTFTHPLPYIYTHTRRCHNSVCRAADTHKYRHSTLSTVSWGVLRTCRDRLEKDDRGRPPSRAPRSCKCTSHGGFLLLTTME